MQGTYSTYIPCAQWGLLHHHNRKEATNLFHRWSIGFLSAGLVSGSICNKGTEVQYGVTLRAKAKLGLFLTFGYLTCACLPYLTVEYLSAL